MGILDRIFGAATPASRGTRIEPTITTPRRGQRMYGGAFFDRLTADWIAQSTSQDSEAFTSIRALRNRARQLCRDNDYAKNAKRLIANNVIGRGVKLQPKIKMLRGEKYNDDLNEEIERAWRRWCKAQNCHTAGKLSFKQIERLLLNETVESGEIFVRLVRQKFGTSRVPLALEVIEADQCSEYRTGRDGENPVRMGVEVDKWQRPVAYWMYPHHPGDLMFAYQQPSRLLRVPAAEIIHLFVSDRAPQTRGISWFHTALKRLHHMEGFEESEVVAARATAALMGFIETPEPMNPDDEPDTVMDGQAVDEFAPGMIRKLGTGEKFTGFAPNRPNGTLDPFMSLMLRGVAAGLGVSYSSLSKDYSKSNYSSDRLARLDDIEVWRVLQDWVIEQFHERVFAAWLDMAVLSGEISIPGYAQAPERVLEQIHWRPRGWGFVDPDKEVSAYVNQVRAGFSTMEDVVEQHGHDFGELMERREREVKFAKDKQMVFDTDPSQVDQKGMAQRALPTDTGYALGEAPPQAAGPGYTAEPAAANKLKPGQEIDDNGKPVLSGNKPAAAPPAAAAPAAGAPSTTKNPQ